MLSKIFYVFISRQKNCDLRSLLSVCRNITHAKSGSWSIPDWLFNIQNRSSIEEHYTIWATGHSIPGDCQPARIALFGSQLNIIVKWMHNFKYVLTKSECQMKLLSEMEI